jgi:mannose-1-phosphate guanylyltransferase/mannose-6-phosphate isomerase
MSARAGKPIVPVILAGGAGRRLSPLSTPEHPKAFLRFSVEGATLLDEALLRVADPNLFAPPLIICGQAHETLVREERAMLPPSGSLIFEPDNRNTAPALAAGALAAMAADKEALILALPADHRIGRTDLFRAAIAQAAPATRKGRIILFGITPSSAHTGYGYIERGQPLEEENGLYTVHAFHEKPDHDTARRYAESGRHDWNAGIVLMRAQTYLAELQRFAPEIESAVRAAWEGRQEDNQARTIHLASSAFAQSPALSVDIAVMEKTDKAALCPAAFDWTDLGSWESIAALPPRAQNIVQRPWGSYEIIGQGPGYKIKRVQVELGQRLSLQRHTHRAEHWAIVSGIASIRLENETFDLSQDQTVNVPAGALHRLANGSPHDPLVLVEVQSGDYLEEDDIERFEDDYGR